MTVDPSIFKSYDIRGIYGQNLFDETAVAIGKAFATYLKPTTVIVGRDGRVSGPALHQNLLAGLQQSGVNVIDIGMVSTDEYYFACATLDFPGIMITASHNPKEYNGFKMVKKIPYLLSGAEGIQEMRAIIEQDAFAPSAAQEGTYKTKDVKEGYLAKITSLVDTTAFKPLKVVADTSNGMVGPALEKFSQLVPQLQMTKIYFEVDGTFPNHGGDPLLEENRRELMARVPAENADFGVTFDPDGDRVFFIDRRGRFIPGDIITAIFAYYFLQREPGSTILYDIRASNAVKDTVQKYGGTAIYNKVGHSYIKKRMMDEDVIFGGEVSGHYYFKDFFFCDGGLVAFAFMLDALSHTDRDFADICDDYFTRYFITGEINNKVADVKAKIEEIKQKYAPSAINVIEVDGITCEFEDWRFNVRGSNTEPLIRLNLEATNQQLMEEKRDEILNVILN